MERLFLYKIKIVVAFLIAFFSFQMVMSQTIERPRRDPASSRICASLGSSTFDIVSGYSSGFSSSNTFSLILSDVNGSFNNSTVLETLGTDGLFELRFSVDFSEFIEPYEGSDDYKLRITSSQFPNATSQSLTIPIFYIDGTVLDTELSILCDSGTIFAIPDDFDEYTWYKADLNGNNPTLIPGETSNTLDVNALGRYYFVIDIGECNQTASVGAAAISNFASVESDNGISVSIAGSTTRSGCSNDPITLSSSTNDPSLSYKWFKGSEELEDGSSATFTVSGSETSTLTVSGIDMEGEYRLAASSGSIGDCTSQSDPVTIELLNPKVRITSETTVLLLPPGEPKTLTAEYVRGQEPIVYTWFKNGSPEPDSNSLSYDVTEEGIYTISIQANSPCPQDNTVLAKEEVRVIPAEDLNITIAYSNPDYEDCELTETVLEVTQIAAIVEGDTVILDQGVLQSLEVDWQKDGESTGETGQTILINSALDNGQYRAVIGDESSGNLPVILGLDSLNITKTPESLPLDGELVLSVGLEDTPGYSFVWFRNINEEIVDSNNARITVTQPGQYTVQVSLNDGSCDPATVGPVTVSTGSPVVPSVITPNDDGINDDWVLPSDYNLQENVEVNIYASNGVLDYSTVNYDGEWPQESKSKAVGTVYYYIINVDNSPVEQGSITIIR